MVLYHHGEVGSGDRAAGGCPLSARLGAWLGTWSDGGKTVVSTILRWHRLESFKCMMMSYFKCVINILMGDFQS